MSDLLNQASLVYIPSGYKEDTAYSVIPTDGSGDLTFTRASDGTRVNSQGLVERVPWNLLTYSENFENAIWILENATIATNNTTAPNGTTTAEKLQEDSSLNKHDVYYGDNSTKGAIVTSGSIYTISIYAKAAERNFMQIAFGTGQVSGNPRVNFNLSTGVISAIDSGINGAIESVGNGWYRCIASATAETGFLTFIAQTQTSGTAARFATYTGTTGEGIYIWGAQLNEGTLKPYFPTTDRLNVPRLDYSNGCPSLLLEPQRTNLVTSSEDIDTGWSKLRVTVENNNTTSPEGFVNAGKSTATAVSGTHASYDTFSGSVTAGNDYFISCFVKKATTKYIRLNEGYTGAYVGFNFDDQTTDLQSGASNLLLEEHINGWYRLGFKFTGDSSGNCQFALYINDNNNNTSYFGSGEAVYLWGAQIEAGSYATSYIPTQGSSVTRVVDAAYKTGITSLIGQTEGTIFVEGTIVAEDSSTNRRLISISDGTTLNQIQIFNRSGTEYLECDCNVLGISQWSIQSGSVGYGTTFKAAIAYKANDIAYFVNGSLIGTDTTATIPATSQLAFSRGDLLFVHEGNINQAVLFKTRLSNTDLASLTTL